MPVDPSTQRAIIKRKGNFMSDQLPKSEIILFQSNDGQTKIQVRFEDKSVWLTQAAIAELFQTTPQNITLHLKAIYTV